MTAKVLKFTKVFTFMTAILAVLLASQSGFAQETRGTIRGLVTDPNGSTVVGATVTISDPTRGTNVTLTTNADGFYQATYLVSGNYTITVENSGFKKFIRENVVIEIGRAVQVDIPLEIGGVGEVVTVNDEIPALNTESGSVGQTIDQRRLTELPLAKGDPYKLMGLSTGVAHTGSQRLDRPFEPTHIVGYAVDGTRGNRSDLTIDGAPSTSTANANEVTASYVPPTDIVQEVKVQTATFDAQFGNTEGGVTSISIKSGTNDLHGSAYYWGEPGNLAANDFFGNSRGQARPDTKSDRFGGNINGPVRLPWLYNGKDKTFFLFGYEGIRDSRPRFDAGAGVYVPTAALRNGDFSAYSCAAGQTSNCVTIYDPLTRNASGTGTAFAGNIIPTNRISPVAKAVLEYYSLPKAPGLLGNIFDSTLAEKTQPYDNYTFRIDQNISDRNRLFVRGSWYDRTSFYNDYLNSAASGVVFGFKARQGVIDDVHTFNSTTVLNVKYGYNRFIRLQEQEEDARGFDLTKLGFNSSYNNLVPADIRRFPRFDFTGGMLGTGFGNETRPTTTHSFSAILNKTFNKHSVKFGGELRIYREDSFFNSNDQTGQFVFNNTFTRPGTAASSDFNGLQAYAAFLLGLPSTQQIVRRSDYSEYSKTYGIFVQDDWKITRKLTLNLGLRYEIETPLVERNNKSVSGFDFAYTQPSEAIVRARLAATPIAGVDPNINVKGGLLFAGKDTGEGLYSTPKNSFLPRFGMAYQWDEKTVIRGGIGLFAGFLGQRRGDVIQPGFTRTTELPLTTLASGAQIPNFIQNFPSINVLEPVGNSLGRQTGLGGGISFFNQDPKVSKQLRWQVGIQREFGNGMVFEAMYVGNYGYDIEITRNINALPAQYLNTDNFRSAAMNANNTFLSANVANPFAGIEEYRGTGLFNATIQRQQLLRPFAGFGDINTTVNDGKSWYHSGQFTLQKRFSKGYTLQSSYTWSKWLQATEYLNASDELPTKMISDQDTPHRLSLSGIYELPFGKGRQFGSNVGGLANALIGNWQIQGVYAFQVGFPIGFTTNLFYNGGDVSIKSDKRKTSQWFFTDRFTSVLTGVSTTNATPVFQLRTLPFRFNDIRRDNINNFDFSVLKDVRFNERMKLQFRFELINALNEPYFPAPVVNPTAVNFGQISASNQDNYARRAQYGIKFLF